MTKLLLFSAFSVPSVLKAHLQRMLNFSLEQNAIHKGRS